MQITNTIFFKHKYLTQPTVTPADANVKAYQNLMHAIQGIPNSKGSAHLAALQQLEQAFEPPQQQQKYTHLANLQG